MAFIEPMQRNKPNITYLLTYLMSWHISRDSSPETAVSEARSFSEALSSVVNVKVTRPSCLHITVMIMAPQVSQTRVSSIGID